jgi:hypothetical protein
MTLLPTLRGPVTGRGCRSLDEVAFSFADPEKAALDLSAWGWRATAYISAGEPTNTTTFVSIHRFATVEGAAKALDAFSSLANEPAGVSVVDPTDLKPNQRGLTEGWWAALVEQDGVLVTRVSTMLLWMPEGPGPIIQFPVNIMESLHAQWVLEAPAKSASVEASLMTSDWEADSEIADSCLALGQLACAKEFFESAYLSAPDGGLSDLYQYYVASGDVWQAAGDLDRARQDYDAAVRRTAFWTPARERLTGLQDFAAVELFDPFTNFSQGFRGCGGPEQMIEAGMRVVNSPQVCDRTAMDWHLDVRLEVPGRQAVHWPHTPQSVNYAVVAELKSTGPSTAIGLNLARSDATDEFNFMVDPDSEEWWIEDLAIDGSWAQLTPLTSFADRGIGQPRRLEVRVRNGSPTFFVNGTDLTAGMELSWLTIPRIGNPGIVVASTSPNAEAPPSATISSFGIYALELSAAPSEVGDDLVTMLPTLDDLPAGFVLREEGARGADEITQTFPNPADAAQRFNAWGWQENAYRDFATADDAISISVSLHRFADDAAASDALSYLAEARQDLLGLAPNGVAELGDQVEAIAGEVAERQEASVYVRRGPIVARITVTASSGDPLPLATEIATRVVDSSGRRHPVSGESEHRG